MERKIGTLRRVGVATGFHFDYSGETNIDQMGDQASVSCPINIIVLD